MAFEMETGPENVVNIKVVGVGGGGNRRTRAYFFVRYSAS